MVDGEPALLRLMLKKQAGDRSNVLVIGWEEFFSKFDNLGLAFVYDNGSPGQTRFCKERNTPHTFIRTTVRGLLRVSLSQSEPANLVSGHVV